MPQAVLLSAGQRRRAKRRVATGSDPSASVLLQASATQHLSKPLSREHFGGTRVKAPAEHRLPVHTKAERELLVNLWAQRGQKPGKDGIKMVLRDFNLCAIEQIEQIKITKQHPPYEQMLFLKDLKQLHQFIKNLTRVEDQRQAQLFSNAARELLPMQSPEYLNINNLSSHGIMPLQHPSMPSPQPLPLAAFADLSMAPEHMPAPGPSLPSIGAANGSFMDMPQPPTGTAIATSQQQPQGHTGTKRKYRDLAARAKKVHAQRPRLDSPAGLHIAAASHVNPSNQPEDSNGNLLPTSPAAVHGISSKQPKARNGSKPPVKAKTTLRGGTKIKKTCWTCWMPKAGHPMSGCPFAAKDDAGKYIEDKDQPFKPHPNYKNGTKFLPVYILNEEGLAKQKALSAISDE